MNTQIESVTREAAREQNPVLRTPGFHAAETLEQEIVFLELVEELLTASAGLADVRSEDLHASLAPYDAGIGEGFMHRCALRAQPIAFICVKLKPEGTAQVPKPEEGSC